MSQKSGISRRRLLAGTSVLGAVGALVACGSDDGGDGSSDPTSPDATAAAPTSGAAAETTGSSGGGTALGSATDIPVGGGKIYTGPKVVVTQPTAGTFKGFSAVCTHQGCTVARIDGANIVCACHNSHFSITDGSVVSGPATKPLPSESVTNTSGTLYLS